MRRTDRLFELIQILRDGRLHTAREMARRLDVSTRTVWRDMDTLLASGLPVAGERGAGYMMTAPITLPPLNLTQLELEALHLGMAAVAQMAEPELQDAARSLAAKVDAVLPDQRRAPAAAGWGFAVHPLADAAKGLAHMPTIRAGLRERRKLVLGYRAIEGDLTERTVRPLQMEYWGRIWTLTVWCELRCDFRVFRIDRIERLDLTPERFDDEPGRTLADYLARFAGGPDGN